MAEVQTLTNEELAALIKNGESGLLPKLWAQVRLFVLKQSRKYIPSDGSNILEQGDFENAGYMAMVETIEKFDPDAGCSFVGYMRFYLSKYFKGVRGWNKKAIVCTSSLDASLPNAEDCTMQELIPDPAAEEAFENTDECLTSHKQASVVLAEMDKLDPRQSNIIREHYFNGKTLDALAANAGLTSERIRQIENAGISKLRRMKKVQEIARERTILHFVDIGTDFYKHKGAGAFQSSGTSAVEDIVERRQRIEEQYHEKYNKFMKEHGTDFYESFTHLDDWYQGEIEKIYH